MNAQACVPPTIIPEFGSYFSREPLPSIFALIGADAPEACLTTLSGQAATDCASFTSWTQYTASFAGVLGVAANLVHQFVPADKKTLATAIITGLHAIYSAVQGVNQQFLVAIHDINAGAAYAPMPQPDPIPPFPDPTPGSDIGQAVESAWNTLKPFLEKAIAKLPTGSPWIKVLEGVIASSDQVIAQLKALFQAIAH